MIAAADARHVYVQPQTGAHHNLPALRQLSYLLIRPSRMLAGTLAVVAAA